MSAEFPFTGSDFEENANNLPIFRIFSWDFEENKFKRDGNGKRILLSGDEAIKVWIYKVLRTERFVWLAYSRKFGIELYPFIAKVMDYGERKSEMKRMIIEALMVNPYIKSIDRIEFSEADLGEKLTVSVDLTTIYGKIRI